MRDSCLTHFLEELFTIDYCFYDGTSQRKSMKLRKGETVRYFLDEARLHFPELKGVSLNDLMFIKVCDWLNEC